MAKIVTISMVMFMGEETKRKATARTLFNFLDKREFDLRSRITDKKVSLSVVLCFGGTAVCQGQYRERLKSFSVLLSITQAGSARQKYTHPGNLVRQFSRSLYLEKGDDVRVTIGAQQISLFENI